MSDQGYYPSFQVYVSSTDTLPFTFAHPVVIPSAYSVYLGVVEAQFPACIYNTSSATMDRKFVDVIAADGSRPRVAVQYAPMHSIGHPESRSALLALVDGLLRSGIPRASRVFTPGDAPPTPRRVGWWASAPPPTHLKAKTDPPTSAGCS